MAFWTPPTALGFAIVALLAGCDADPSPTTVTDARLPDAAAETDGLADSCTEMLSAGELELARCDGGRRFELRRGGEVVLGEGQAGFEIAGRRVSTGDYPQVVWRTMGGTAEARFFDLPEVPEVQLTLRLERDALVVETVLFASERATVDRIVPLSASLSAPHAEPAPEIEAPGIFVAGIGVGGRGVEVDVEDDLLTVVTTDPPAVVLDEAAAPPVVVRVGDDARALRRAHTAALAVRAGQTAPQPTPGWGWLGAAADAVEVSAALRTHPAAPTLGPPLLVVDADDAPLDVSPARLGVRWAPYAGADPARPEDRDAAARVAAELVESGVAALMLDLPAARAVGGDALRVAVGAIHEAAGETPLVALTEARALLGRVGAGTPWRRPLNTPPEQARALAAWWHYAPAALHPWVGPVHAADDAGAARQSAVVVALAGGPYLLGADPRALDAAQLAAFFDPLILGPLGPAEPADTEDPPATWRTERATAYFNWTDEPRAFEADDGNSIEIPAHDVVVLMRTAR